MHSNAECSMKVGMIVPVIFLEGIVLSLVVLYFRYYILDISVFWVKITYAVIYWLLVIIWESHYLLCFLSNPGSVSDSWSAKNLDKVLLKSEDEKREFLSLYPDQTSNYNSSEAEKRYSYCGQCKLVKPERAHHCKVCEKCYLKMDHHCIWVGNCIGYYNHKFFVVFLFYSVLISAIMVSTISCAINDILSLKRPFELEYTIAIVLCLFLSTAYLFASILMFSTQLYLSMNNKTTIECRQFEESNPYYDRGCFQNLKHVLGEDVLLWLLPTRPKLKIDGHAYVKSSSVSSSETNIVIA